MVLPVINRPSMLPWDNVLQAELFPVAHKMQSAKSWATSECARNKMGS